MGGAPLAVAGLLIGAWASLPPYSGPEINTETRVEVADHVIPAVVLVGLSLWALLRTRSAGAGGKGSAGSGLLIAGFGVLLAGLWMTATHLPLVAQARRDEVSAAAALYHTLPGLAVLGLGVLWAARHWNDAAGPVSG
ncbi:MAG: hypothetical protein ACRD1K_17415 [Acidimicrobiales bacterium]